MERTKLGDFKLCYSKDRYSNREHNAIELFIAYLIETKQIVGYEDEQRKWVKLNDLLKYNGYFIPDINYGYSNDGRAKYYYEIILNNIPTWSLLEESTGMALDYILAHTMSFFNENRGHTTVEKIKYYMNSEEARYDLSESSILEWLIPAKNPKAIDAIGAVKFNTFVAADENNIAYIMGSDVSGYGETTNHTWKLIYDLLIELGAQKITFKGSEVYNVDEQLFRVLGKDKYVLHTMDEHKELEYTRPYELNNGLYEFYNPKGKVCIQQQYFICKECGQIFRLYEDEIDFFNRKQLHIPSRCIKCRKGLPHPDWGRLVAEKKLKQY